MGIYISTRNSKLGLIPSVNLPPVITCEPNAPCFKGCYARKGRFAFASVLNTMSGNYALWSGDPDAYFNGIKKYLIGGVVSYNYFRFHAAGDIPNEDYFKRMVKLAKEIGSTQFLAFTKKFHIVNDYLNKHGKLPENLHIVFSAWDKGFEVNNPYNLPVAYVSFRESEKNPDIPADARKCSGDCTNCLECWKIKKGESVTFHQH